MCLSSILARPYAASFNSAFKGSFSVLCSLVRWRLRNCRGGSLEDIRYKLFNVRWNAITVRWVSRDTKWGLRMNGQGASVADAVEENDPSSVSRPRNMGEKLKTEIRNRNRSWHCGATKDRKKGGMPSSSRNCKTSSCTLKGRSTCRETTPIIRKLEIPKVFSGTGAHYCGEQNLHRTRSWKSLFYS